MSGTTLCNGPHRQRRVAMARVLFSYPVAIAGTMMLLSSGAALAQQGSSACNWKKYLYAQDAVQQGKIDTNPLNQMSALVSAQGYSLTNKVLQTCNGWLMEAKRADGSPAVVFVDPKTQTIVDADFR